MKLFDRIAGIRIKQFISFNGWGVSILDGLDTMWIMGLHEEFEESMPFVANMTFALDPVRFHFYIQIAK